MFHLIKQSSQTKARLGQIQTDHGKIPTPVFMPVGTAGTVKAVKQDELIQKLDVPVILGNTYHLYLRPGNEILREAGGLHRFMNWERPLLTDSGGFQVFSLSDIRDVKDEGVEFQSHIDGSRHLFTPENVVETQRIFGSDIMMMLDECPPYPSSREDTRESMERTHQWAKRADQAFKNSKSLYNHRQFQFGIIQGGTHKELRKQSAQFFADLDPDGIAIGGLSVGEPIDLMYSTTDWTTDFIPSAKPRYLMGVGKPANILESIARGIDMFDCVIPTRNARNGMIFTWEGTINLNNAKWKHHHQPLDLSFPSDLAQNHSMSYIRHLFNTREILGLQLATLHNLAFYQQLLQTTRQKIEDDTFHQWYPAITEQLAQRI